MAIVDPQPWAQITGRCRERGHVRSFKCCAQLTICWNDLLVGEIPDIWNVLKRGWKILSAGVASSNANVRNFDPSIARDCHFRITCEWHRI